MCLCNSSGCGQGFRCLIILARFSYFFDLYNCTAGAGVREVDGDKIIDSVVSRRVVNTVVSSHDINTRRAMNHKQTILIPQQTRMKRYHGDKIDSPGDSILGITFPLGWVSKSVASCRLWNSSIKRFVGSYQ